MPRQQPTDPAPAVAVPPVRGAFPDVSDDGRWVVYEGEPDDGSERTRTIWLQDRATPDAPPVELTPPPADARAGNSVRPAISGDGCVVAAVTEVAFDLFRDDDTGDRWDVYRLVLPHCAGADGNWDLVSSTFDVGSELSAIDRASPQDPPAVSDTGAVIAYTFEVPDGRGPSGPDEVPLLAVSVVDLSVAVGDFGRLTTVAGTPAAAPDTTFRYRGQREPALSGDGRFVAFTSDARSEAEPPVWGDGPTAGGFATSQVFLWDREQPDPAADVTLVSAAPDGTPAATGASAGAVSGDGRFVVYESTSADLAPGAVLPPCATTCPPQVHRFDQAERTTVLVSRRSAAGAGEPATAADLGASQPAISHDGTQVAFVTRSTNLFPTSAAPGTDPSDGEIVVSEVELGVLRRASVLPDGVTPAPAVHSNPALSGTGHVLVFDTLAEPELSATAATAPAGRDVAARARPAELALADLDIGTIAVGLPSPEWFVALRNEGPSTFTPALVTSSSSAFAVTGGTCGLGLPVPPGGSCTVNVVLTPAAAGPVTGTLTVAETLFGGASVSATMAGAGGEPILAPSPGGADMAPTVVGSRSVAAAFDIANIGFTPAVVTSISLAGANPEDFVVTDDSCRGRALNPATSCSVSVAFRPVAGGYRTATVLVTAETGQYTGVLVNGTATYAPRLVAASTAVAAGDALGVGGSGFAPDAEVALSWADGYGERLVVRTDGTGSFLVSFPTKRGERAGDRVLVAQGPNSTVEVGVQVIKRPVTAGPGSPVWGG